MSVSVRVARIGSEGPTNASAPRQVALERRLGASPTVKDTTDV